MYSAGFGRVNRTVWHRSTPVGFCREEGGEVEGKFDRGGWRWRVGRAYPNLFSKRPPRIVSTTSTTTTRPRTPMLPYVIPFLFCFPAVPFARHHLFLPPPTNHSLSLYLSSNISFSLCLSNSLFQLAPRLRDIFKEN